MKKTTKKTTAVEKTAKTAKTPKTAKKASAKTSAPAVVPARKSETLPREIPATAITARIDVGFGNHLYLRGEAPGLSWDHGVAMDCAGADEWTATVKGASAPVVFKVLINDETWCAGNDYVVEPGQSVTVNPTF